MKIKNKIPNTLTLLNLSMGSISVLLSFAGFSLELSFLFIIAGAVFDFFDGFSARLLKAYSPIGKELDSLADLISFGLAPTAIMFRLILESLNLSVSDLVSFSHVYVLILPFFSFFIVMFSALRLANFNIDENQTKEFIGLPTPANAIFISSLVFLKGVPMLDFVFSIYSLILISIVFSFLLTSKLPMFSLKIKSLKWKENTYQFLLLFLSILLVIIYKWQSFSFIILVYILLNVIRLKIKFK